MEEEPILTMTGKLNLREVAKILKAYKNNPDMDEAEAILEIANIME